MSAFDFLAKRTDDWTSRLLGFGTATDAFQQVRVERTAEPKAEYLDDVYARDTVAQSIVEEIVKDALREGWTFGHPDAELAEETRKWLEKEFKLTGFLRDVAIRSRLTGTCLVHPLVEDNGSTEMPLRRRAVEKVIDLRRYDRGELFIESSQNDFAAKDFGAPEIYRVSPTPRIRAHATPFNLHASRVYAVDAPVDTERTRYKNHGFPESVLTPLLPWLAVYNVAGSALGHLIGKQGTPKYGIKGLNKILQGNASKLRDRFVLMEQLRSTMNALLLDADMETLDLMQSPLQGLADVFDRVMQILSQKAKMPMVKLFGMSPAGLNATGESDMRIWYDQVQSFRADVLEPLLLWFVSLAVQDRRCPAYGRNFEPEIVWPSLWQPTPLESADGSLKVAQADAIYLQHGVYDMSDVARARAQPDGWMQSISLPDPEALAKYLPDEVPSDNAPQQGETPTSPERAPTPPPVPAAGGGTGTPS